MQPIMNTVAPRHPNWIQTPAHDDKWHDRMKWHDKGLTMMHKVEGGEAGEVMVRDTDDAVKLVQMLRPA